MNICNLKPCNFLAFPSLFQSIRSVIIVATRKDNHNSSFFVIALPVFRLVAIIQHPKVFSYLQGRCTLPRSFSCNIHPHQTQSSPPFSECFCSILYHKSAFRNQVSRGRTEIPRNSLLCGLLKYTVSLCNKNQLDAVFILSLFRHQPLHISGVFVAHHQEAYCIHTTIDTY